MFSSNTSAANGAANYIEDVFSTYLYTGNGSTQTITNGIDLSTKGGLTWIKSRTDASDHSLEDTLRTVSIYAATLSSNTTAAQSAGDITAFTTSGFSLRDYTGTTNSSGTNYVSWTFRKQPKFFDVVTFTAGTSTNQRISHSLGSVPACIIIKCTSTTSGWYVYHRSLGRSQYMRLEATSAAVSSTNIWGTSDPTSTDFGVNAPSLLEGSGTTYVAYLFAHNAAGFGLTGTDNVISCGSFTTDGSGKFTVNLGYEPQWIMIKLTNFESNWSIFDNMRGMPVGSPTTRLLPNTSDAESSAFSFVDINATGFASGTGSGNPYSEGQNWIYVAIRRGPMKVPTDATKVFSPNASNAPSNGTQITTNFPIDLGIWKSRGGSYSGQFQDRLRGLPSTAGTGTVTLYPDSTAAESNNQSGYEYWNTGFKTYSGENNIWWSFRRAPSFFDEVCYTGTGNVGSDATRITHNLGVAPELIIVKSRSNAYDWIAYTANNGVNKFLLVNTTDALGTITGIWATTAPTSTTFGVSNGGGSYNNGAGMTYVAYLFATCAGVSKVGSYTGTGTTLQVNCGFTAGARFVLIKRTDSAGNWYVWDSARGIVSGNDPYLLLNSTAAEVTNTDYVDTYSAGFEISSTAPAAINASGGSYIFLAIA